MSETILVEMTPGRVEVEPGATPAETTVTIRNLSRVVEQFTTEVVGLDEEWFSASEGSVGLFPQDRDQMRVTFHPPKRPGVKAGTYPFKVIVRSRKGGEEEAVDGVLDVKGVAIYRMDLQPRRLTSRRRGNYEATITNSGTADAKLSLSVKDEEEACKFKLKAPDTVVVPAGSKVEFPLQLTPKKRPLIGPERTYDFTLTGRPADTREDPRTVQGQFVFRPLFPSWAPFRTALFWLVAAFMVLIGAGVLNSMGVFQEFPRRAEIAGAQARAFACRVPLVGGLCPGNVAAAEPQPNADCVYGLGFKTFAEAEKVLVGPCTSDEGYDGFGNAVQYSENGVLLWIKASNQVYFFVQDRLYTFIDGRTRQLDGPRV